MKNYIKGDELMVFNNSKSLAHAKSHTLSLSTNEIDISSKDYGYWGASEAGNLAWEITSENLFTEDYDALFTAWVNKTTLPIVFGYAANYDVNGLAQNQTEWAPDTAKKRYSGTAIITSLQINANTGEIATYSVTFKGVGALTPLAAQ